METPNYRKASIYFDDETVLEVEQRGGGGSGVGGDTGLSAVNLITGESTNAALAEKDETIEQQAGTIEEQEATIETQAATISDLEDEVAAKQAIIDAFPTIEALNVTANGTYSEDGKAYKPVTVNVEESYSIIYIDNTSVITIVNNTAADIHYPDIPKINAIPPTIYDNVDINIITIPAGGSANLTIAGRGFYKKPGKTCRYALRPLEDLTNKTVTVTPQSLVSGTIDAYPSGIFLSTPSSTPYFNHIITIS